MNRKPTKNTRGPNVEEKRLMNWVKEQSCCICRRPGPSIVDHMYSSTFRHLKVLIGMWALLPYCERCDQVKTQGSHRMHEKIYHTTQAKLWEAMMAFCPYKAPQEVTDAIMDWGR